MQSNGKRHGNLIAIQIITFLFWVLLINSCRYELAVCKDKEVNRSIAGYTLNVATLDTYLRKQFPRNCRKLELTGATLQATVADCKITDGTLRMIYFRYFDAHRKSGNVVFTRFYIDPVKQEVQRLQWERGESRGMSGSGVPICEQTLSFPWEQYVQNAAVLAGVPKEQPLRLIINSEEWGLDVFVYSMNNKRLYCERIADWSPGTPFEERKHVPIDWREWYDFEA